MYEAMTIVYVGLAWVKHLGQELEALLRTSAQVQAQPQCMLQSGKCFKHKVKN